MPVSQSFVGQLSQRRSNRCWRRWGKGAIAGLGAIALQFPAAAQRPPVTIPVPPVAGPPIKRPVVPPAPPAARSSATPAAPAMVDFSRYRLGPGDTLFVNVLRFPDLSFQGTIDLEGNLLVPLAGALRLDGLAIAQARNQIRDRLNRFVIDPQVDVILVAQRPVRVTVLGEVFRPGYYPMENPQLAIALLAAGGTTGQADLRSVRVRRLAPDGGSTERTLDLYSPLLNATALPAVRLADGDTIIVSALTPTTRASYDPTLVARSTLAQPQINIRVLNYSNSLGGSRSSNAIGSIALPNGSTFVDALTAISPNPDTADFSDIALIRYDPDQGRAVTREFNGRRALRGDASENPPLQHNDVIIIGRNFISQVTRTLNTFTQPFRDVLGFLLFFDSLNDAAGNLFAP